MRRLSSCFLLAGVLFIACPAYAARILCFGDSITLGSAVEGSWVEIAQEMRPDHVWVNDGFGGRGTDATSTANFQFAIDTGVYQIATILLGINDSMLGFTSEESAVSIYGMARYAESRGVIVFVLTPTPVLPSTSEMLRRRAQDITRQLVYQQMSGTYAGIHLVDVHAAFSGIPFQATDGMHPKRASLGIIAGVVTKALAAYGL